MRIRLQLLAGLLLVATAALPQSQTTTQPPSDAVGQVPGSRAPQSSAESLYLQLRSAALDKSRVYRLRDASIDRAAFQITLNEGIIAFTVDVAGRVTGAFFQGDAEILLSPPNQYERASMALFTGVAILEERFVTAYFRFNDDTFAEMQPSLIPVDDGEPFVAQWNETARTLAQADALRLLMSFSRLLPVVGQPGPSKPTAPGTEDDDRFLHARFQGL